MSVKYISISLKCKQKQKDMRTLFETGKMTEYVAYKNNKPSVRVTMTDNKCFDIRKFNESLGVWVQCFETSAFCGWDVVKKRVQFLLK